MFPTLISRSKALRLPLNSKKANKDFYKGTGVGNMLRNKRIAAIDKFGRRLKDKDGRDKEWVLRQKELDERKLPCYVVPPGLLDTELKPYVLTHYPDAKDAALRVPNPRPGYIAPTSTGEESTHNIKFSPGGMSGETYTALQRAIWERRIVEPPLVQETSGGDE